MIVVIVIDCFIDKSNGTAISANNLVSSLKEKGHTVRVVSPYIDGNWSVKERYIPLVTEISHKQRMHFGEPDEDILKDAFNGADIIHFFLPFKLEIVGVKIAIKMNVPFIGAFHLQPEHITYNIKLNKVPLIHKFIFWYFKIRFYKYIKHIHCPSELIKNELIKHKYKSKLFVISNGFNNTFKKIEHVKNDDLFHIVMTGRYSYEKRQDVLINAIKLSKYEKKIKLHLKGAGPKEDYYKKLSKQLSNEVDFGFASKDELARLYSIIDLYVHASDVDGEAISALEAIACGIVPIISDSPMSATKQFALDSRSLFRSGCPSDLAKKIDYFIENKSEFKSLSSKYIDSARKYELSVCVDKMIEMYNEAINDFSNARY